MRIFKVQVFTRLDQAPAINRTLHVAYEQAGTRTAGQLFQGQIPRALVEQLKRSGRALEKTLQWQGAAGAAKTYTAKNGLEPSHSAVVEKIEYHLPLTQ